MNNLVKDILKNLVLVVVVLLFVVLLSGTFGRIYMSIFNEGGSWIGADWVAGFIPVYVLFTAFVFSTWGDRKRYLWILVLIIPTFYFIYSINLPNNWIEPFLFLIGIGTGEGLRRLLLKNKQ